MIHYQIPAPRKFFALGAVAMTAITIALSVVVPARIQSGDRDARMLATSAAIAPVPLEAVTDRLCIEVVGVREPELVSVDDRSAPTKRKQES